MVTDSSWVASACKLTVLSAATLITHSSSSSSVPRSSSSSLYIVLFLVVQFVSYICILYTFLGCIVILSVIRLFRLSHSLRPVHIGIYLFVAPFPSSYGRVVFPFFQYPTPPTPSISSWACSPPLLPLARYKTRHL